MDFIFCVCIVLQGNWMWISDKLYVFFSDYIFFYFYFVFYFYIYISL